MASPSDPVLIQGTAQRGRIMTKILVGLLGAPFIIAPLSMLLSGSPLWRIVIVSPFALLVGGLSFLFWRLADARWTMANGTLTVRTWRGTRTVPLSSIKRTKETYRRTTKRPHRTLVLELDDDSTVSAKLAEYRWPGWPQFVEAYTSSKTDILMAFDRGESVQVGPVSMSATEVVIEGRTVPWSGVVSIRHHNEGLSFQLDDGAEPKLAFDGFIDRPLLYGLMARAKLELERPV